MFHYFELHFKQSPFSIPFLFWISLHARGECLIPEAQSQFERRHHLWSHSKWLISRQSVTKFVWYCSIATFSTHCPPITFSLYHCCDHIMSNELILRDWLLFRWDAFLRPVIEFTYWYVFLLLLCPFLFRNVAFFKNNFITCLFPLTREISHWLERGSILYKSVEISP